MASRSRVGHRPLKHGHCQAFRREDDASDLWPGNDALAGATRAHPCSPSFSAASQVRQASCGIGCACSRGTRTRRSRRWRSTARRRHSGSRRRPWRRSDDAARAWWSSRSPNAASRPRSAGNSPSATRSVTLPSLVVVDLLSHRDAERLGQPAVDLPLDDHRVDARAAIVERVEAAHLRSRRCRRRCRSRRYRRRTGR